MKKAPGFTLLEVMAAVTILAIGLIGLLSLQNQTVFLSQNSKDITIAALMAKEAYTEKEMELRGFTGLEDRPQALSKLYPAYKIEEPEVIPLQLPIGEVPPLPLSLIRVTVRWKTGGSEQIYTLNGIVAPGIYGEIGR
ncbi:MAG: prepilin-type N-terminal cleavage/methylation domain-containing protein [Proteobacteria bacterium]|nr:prepilin-type N-terminal cleavage/methylation domain-containing protein [Pseudomonadota bacterium]